MILGLYEELRDHYRDQFLFWLQYAMAHIDRGDLDVAENYLNQTSAICADVKGNPFQIRHQQGILYLMQTCQCQPISLGKERAEDGIKILQGLIRERGDTDAYPYTGYMDYVTRWYVAAGELVSNDEWDDLKKAAQLAAKKYPMEDMVLEGRNKVERAYLMRVVTDRDTVRE